MSLLNDDKGEDLVEISLNGKSSMADYMIVVSGRSSRHVSSMAAHILDKLKPHVPSISSEGQSGGDWVLVDAGDVIVHLFRPEVREFYQIEKLWSEPEAWMKNMSLSSQNTKDSESMPLVSA